MDKIQKTIDKDLKEVMLRFRKKERIFRLYESFFGSFDAILKDLKESVTDVNSTVFKGAIHTLKGASGNIMMSAIADVCITIEDNIKNNVQEYDYAKAIESIQEYAKMYKNSIEIN